MASILTLRQEWINSSDSLGTTLGHFGDKFGDNFGDYSVTLRTCIKTENSLMASILTLRQGWINSSASLVASAASWTILLF